MTLASASDHRPREYRRLMLVEPPPRRAGAPLTRRTQTALLAVLVALGVGAVIVGATTGWWPMIAVGLAVLVAAVFTGR